MEVNIDNPEGFVLSTEERQDIIDEMLTYVDETDGVLQQVINAEADPVTTLVDASGNIALDATLASSSGEILKDFNFGTTDYAGAVKSGNLLWSQSTGAITSGSGVALYRSGIVGASGGVTTFSISATTGAATFKGTVTSGSVLSAGDITSGGTITGCTVRSAASGSRTELTSGNRLNFYYGTALSGQMFAEADGDLRIYARDDIKFRTANQGTVAQVKDAGIVPDSDFGYDLGGEGIGGSNYRWDNIYGKTFHGGSSGTAGTTHTGYGFVNGIRSDGSDATDLEYRYSEIEVQGGIVTDFDEGSWENIPAK